MTDDAGKTRVTILTANYRIKGCIDIIAGARVTDYFIEAKGFIALTDAEVWEISAGRQVCTAPFLNISRDHIVVIVPGAH
jgi:hypothetical protein